MKHVMEDDVARSGKVAPCAGAWIETRLKPTGTLRTLVAPCAGAWIETV